MIKIKNYLKEFQGIIKIIANYAPETNFCFEKEGITVKAIHQTNVSLCRVVLNKSLFEEYDIEKNITYTINTELFSKMINKVGKKELILNIKDEGLIMNNSKDIFKLNYYVGTNDERNFPQFEYSSIWKIKTEELLNTILELKDFSEIICLVDDGKLKCRTRANLIEGETILDAINEKTSNVKSYYTTEFFDKIDKIKDIFNEVTLKFSDETPCYIKGEHNGVLFEWMLAARINDGGNTDE